MYENQIYERYSDDRKYKYEIYKRINEMYEICILFRETDEYVGRDWFQYTEMNSIAHFTDTLERAIEIGDEELYNLE